jgi:ABC-type polysaccharide/polyol phosphate transport system ATPase subunit
LNGAGKSTLLRLIGGVYTPTRGQMVREGSVASLFDLQLGMDMEATGYQNIVLKGLFLGLSRAEIERRLPDIVAFTDLGDYLAMPVRTYSSGMTLRLAFAVATSVRPDITLMDEWLGVGDAHFLKKATERLHSLVHESSILLLASHSESLMRDICNRGVLMNQGHVIADGPIDDVMEQYAHFGPQPFFDPAAYIRTNPDVRAAVECGDTQPWLHFMTWGVFEPRDLGNGVSMEQFSQDPVYLKALQRGDNVSAIERVGQVVPFLPTFRPPAGWEPDPDTPLPTDFVPPDGLELVVPPHLAPDDTTELPQHMRVGEGSCRGQYSVPPS